MPLYTFQCPQCGRTDRIFRKVSGRNESQVCDAVLNGFNGDGQKIDFECRVLMHRIIEAPAVHADLPGYQSPIDGSWIEGRSARNEDLKRNNCRPWEGMSTERNEAIKRAEEADKKFETSIEKGIADTFNNMSVEKQRVLNEAL